MSTIGLACADECALSKQILGYRPPATLRPPILLDPAPPHPVSTPPVSFPPSARLRAVLVGAHVCAVPAQLAVAAHCEGALLYGGDRGSAKRVCSCRTFVGATGLKVCWRSSSCRLKRSHACRSRLDGGAGGSRPPLPPVPALGRPPHPCPRGRAGGGGGNAAAPYASTGGVYIRAPRPWCGVVEG